MLRIIAAALLGLVAVAPCPAQDAAKDYPNRAIHIVVPFPAGGPADVAARLLAQRMSEDWGQPVIVDNRPGGNTVIGAPAGREGHARRLHAADGDRFHAGDEPVRLQANLSYDPFTDFVPITTTTKTVSVLAVSGADGPKYVQELIARAKAAPGKLNYGAGTITAQLMGYRFHKAAGIDIQYVPFKGTPATVNGLLTGSVDVIYAANVTVNPLIESGKVRALAKLDRRSPASMAERADARRRRRPAEPRRHVGLARPRRAQGHAATDHRQAQRKIVQIMADPADAREV